MEELYKINGNPEEFADLDVFHKLSQQFLPFIQKRLEFDKPVGINLISDPENAKDPLGKTAYYNPSTMEVTVFVDNRHVKDILRSMSHELVHHTQNCRGEFDGGAHTGPGYAQEDEHMRKMEEEAYLKGQMTLRDFEDNLKENKTMSKKRLKEQAAKRAVNQLDPNDPGYTGKFNVDYKDPVTMPQTTGPAKQRKRAGGSLERLMLTAAKYLENAGASEYEVGVLMQDLMVKAGVNLDPGRNLLDPKTAHPDTMDAQKRADRTQMKKGDVAGGQADEARFEEGKEPVEEKQFPDLTDDGKVTQADILKGRGVELEEESLEEGDGTICEECGGSGLHETHCGKGGRAHGKKDDKKEKEPLEEGWSNKKDQLLFERLVDKWIK